MYRKEGEFAVGALFIIVFLMILSLLSMQAKADDKVDGVIIGIAATKLFEAVLEDINNREGVIYVPGDVDDFPPFKCSSEDSVTCAYERGVYDRDHRAYKQQKIYAYECGRFKRNCNKVVK